MAGYWNTVPLGNWSVTDSFDALQALRDPDSRALFHTTNNRVHVLGPIGKSIIIHLNEIHKALSDEDFEAFMHSVLEFDPVIMD